MKIIYPLLFAIFLSSCSTPPNSTLSISLSETPTITETPRATLTAVCVPSGPTEEDIDSALAYSGDVFDPAEWEQSHVVGEENISVAWQNIPQRAVAFLETVIFACGYEEPDLNHYLNDEHWDVVFANYDSYEMIDECRSDDGLRLYEFEAVSQELDYNIRYWTDNETAERVVTIMLTFPLDSEDLMDEYSIDLFPELPNCS